MTIRLARLSLREIRLPLAEPFRTAGGTVDVRRILLAELRDSDGLSSWSECVAENRPTYAPDTVDTCWLALHEWIAPLLLGRELDSAASAHAVLGGSVRGHNMARATLEMGLWALEANRRDVSLAALLATAAPVTDAADEPDGTARSTGPASAPRSHVSAGIALGLQPSPDALVERARAAAAQGYRRIKMKVSPGHDVAWVRAVREALGAVVPLAVDANCSYALESADDRAALAELDALGLSMIEQPLAHDDLVRHAELQRSLRTRLCLDESIHDAASVRSMLALGSARMVNLKAGRVGGFHEALAIHDRCVKSEIPLWCGGMLECGIGRAYNVALASLRGFTEPGDLSPSSRYWARDVVTTPWTMTDGQLRVPLERPGIGVDVDVDFVDSRTVRASVLTAP